MCVQLQHCTIYVQSNYPWKPIDDQEQFMCYHARPIVSLYLLEVIMHQLDCFGEVHKVEIKTLKPSSLNLNLGCTTLTLDKLFGLSIHQFFPCEKIKIITYITYYLLQQEGQLMQHLADKLQLISS